AEDGIRDRNVTGVQTCALPILSLFASNVALTYRKTPATPPAPQPEALAAAAQNLVPVGPEDPQVAQLLKQMQPNPLSPAPDTSRSEERRVGKECRSKRATEQYT